MYLTVLKHKQRLGTFVRCTLKPVISSAIYYRANPGRLDVLTHKDGGSVLSDRHFDSGYP
ncbi:hypothetical protein [Pseudomonas fluorescens]|uniref:hypothetical protein n=1 Tax=Pseudomonas fluorescens TaxID=294 RepID=UPI001C446794|nr:hypothetical protein [Pseudomonas fluorescens]QXN50468.1 hypothetical protein KW062_01430 [Pseudomonas fluorescens]WSO24784.1 hypothetical protein VUJ50_01440 [Pseudomonas fluorescens]